MNREVVEEAIRTLLKKAGPHRIRTKKVICSLPETKAFLRVLSMPQMTQKETAEAINGKSKPISHSRSTRSTMIGRFSTAT